MAKPSKKKAAKPDKDVEKFVRDIKGLMNTYRKAMRKLQPRK
jgi:hypothetical protein